jgi:hypothetical protein
MKPIFDPEELTLMTEDESRVFSKYVHECERYMDGKVDGVKMKQATAQMANITRLVQTRSATALLKFNMLNRGDVTLINNMTQKRIEKKK